MSLRIFSMLPCWYCKKKSSSSWSGCLCWLTDISNRSNSSAPFIAPNSILQHLYSIYRIYSVTQYSSAFVQHLQYLQCHTVFFSICTVFTVSQYSSAFVQHLQNLQCHTVLFSICTVFTVSHSIFQHFYLIYSVTQYSSAFVQYLQCDKCLS